MTNYSNTLFKGKGKKKTIDTSEFVFHGQLEKKINPPNTNTSPKGFLPGPWWLVLRMHVSGKENVTHHWVKDRPSPGWKSVGTRLCFHCAKFKIRAAVKSHPWVIRSPTGYTHFLTWSIDRVLRGLPLDCELSRALGKTASHIPSKSEAFYPHILQK